MKSGIIMQARLGSTRLPQKMLLPLNSQTVIEFLLNRLRNTNRVDELIVATTTESEDDRLEQYVKNLSVSVSRGSTWNVLDRFYQAAQLFQLDIIVRICADNPFLEPSEISRLIALIKEHRYDYLANCLQDGTHLILTGTGMAVEVFTMSALQKMIKRDLDQYHREHVTPYFYENPQEFNIHFSPVPFNLEKEVRLTLDLSEDYSIIKEIYEELSPNISIQRIIKYLTQNPKLFRKMKEIAQQQIKGRAQKP
jgi:spore coat polysaccharide biosynthesis protein SpsF